MGQKNIEDYAEEMFRGIKDTGIKETFDEIKRTAQAKGFSGEYSSLCRIAGSSIGMDKRRARSLEILGTAYDKYRMIEKDKELTAELKKAFRQDDPIGYMKQKRTVENINEYLRSKEIGNVNNDILVYSMYAAGYIGRTGFISLNDALVKRGLSQFMSLHRKADEE